LHVGPEAVNSSGDERAEGPNVGRPLPRVGVSRKAGTASGAGGDRASRQGDLRLLWRLMAEARPLRRQVIVFILVSLLAVPLTLLAPVPLALAIDAVAGDQATGGPLAAILPDTVEDSTTGLIVFAVGLLLVVALLTELQRLAASVIGTRTGERLALALRSRLFAHAQRLSLTYHDTHGSFDTVYRILMDASAVQWVAVYGIAPFITAILTLIGMLVVTARVDLVLAGIALLIAPVLVMLTQAYRGRLRDGWLDVRERESGSLAVLQEVLGALRVVRAFGRERHEQRRFHTKSSERLESQVRVVTADGVLGLLIGMSTAVGTAAVLYVGATGVQEGRITPGELILVLGYLAQIYLPLQTVTQGIATLQASLASGERVFEIIDREPEVGERPDAVPLARAAGAIALEGVSFRYRGGPEVLHDVTFAVEPGTTVGIAGATGAGKSTLVSLLPRFYDATAGRVLLDGRDVRELRIEDLRAQFGVMLQEPVLFSVSIAENIAYGRPGSSRAEIEQAARLAHAHEFVSALPDRYDTVVGERGASLSLGERQRISLARTFLRDASVLILDEPTSSVDVRTEALIMDALHRLMAGRTTFVIAHRLSTLERCDVLLEMEDGRVTNSTTRVGWALRRRLDAAAGLHAVQADGRAER
jgi:ATP-binding cassette, subfamily B, bacterial